MLTLSPPAVRRLAGREDLAWAAVVVWCAVLFLPGLDRGPLRRTEGLRALLGRQALAGDWIVPTLHGEPLLTKPPGHYAAIALCSLPFGGVTEVSARLPSVLAGFGTVLLVFWYSRRCLGTAGGLVTALLVPCGLAWLDRVPSAEIDALQVFWVTASVLLFLRGLEDAEPGSRPWGWLSAALACVAGGFLTKWTAPAFFYLAVVPLLAWRRRLALLVSGPHLLAVAVGGGLSVAWVVGAVARVGWPAFWEAVGGEAWRHLAPQPQARPHPLAETLAHPFVVVGSALPGAALALWAFRPGRLDGRARLWWQGLHCWAWPNLLFWTLASEHSPRHALPLLPALAGLAGVGIACRVNTGGARLALVVAGLWLGVRLGYEFVWLPARPHRGDPRVVGARLAELVPPETALRVGLFKDEGALFYLGQPTRRWVEDRLPFTAEPVYAVWNVAEWGRHAGRPGVTVVGELHDQQGERAVVVRIGPPGSGEDRP